MQEEVLEFPGSVDGPWGRYVQAPDGRGIGTVRYPRRVTRSEAMGKLLAARTLTNLYNQRPTWLEPAHPKLDEAVFAACGWDAGLCEEEVSGRLLALARECDYRPETTETNIFLAMTHLMLRRLTV